MAAKSISELRKQRGNIDALTKKLEEQNSKGGGSQDDDRFWQCALDKAGNGQAVIRFLPAPQGEDDAWVRMFTHGFQGPTGKWYIENSLTTLSTKSNFVKDPVQELNNELWASKVESNIEIARKQKRKLNYYSNVLIISDPANPENEGKVKLFRYGAKIFEKLQAAMKPEFEGDPSFNPFCFFEGADFRLKITKKDGFANFDKSSLAASKPLSEDDDELQKIWDQCHSLKELVSADKFKTYEELEKRLNAVLATGAKPKTAEQSEMSEEDQEFIRSQKARAKQAEQDSEDVPAFEPTTSKPKASAAKQADDDSDDDLAYFRQLANS